MENLLIHSPATEWTADIAVAQVDGRTAVVRQYAKAPLKLLCPRSPGDAAWIVTSSYGGGLVSGDIARLRIDCAAGTKALLSTQASTKVYRSDGRAAAQEIAAHVGDDAVLAIAPDPTTCFAEARFSQEIRVDLAPSASLLLLDWYTSGRHAVGERWQFAGQRNVIEIRRNGKLAFRDAQLLTCDDGPLAGRQRMGRFNCVATLAIMGAALEAVKHTARDQLSSFPIAANSGLIASLSPLGDDLIVRAASEKTETLSQFLHGLFAALPRELPEYWTRKW